MTFTRAESLLGSCKAPSVNIRYRTGATRDGRITAVDVEVTHGAGSWAPFLIDKTTKGVELCFYETLGALLSHATGPYEIENVRARAWDVLTNGPRYVPLRGTNANYLPLAYESQVDLVAEKLGLDPIEVRLRNAIRTGSKDPFRADVDRACLDGQELEMLRPHYDQARARLEKPQSRNRGRMAAGHRRRVRLAQYRLSQDHDIRRLRVGRGRQGPRHGGNGRTRPGPEHAVLADRRRRRRRLHGATARHARRYRRSALPGSDLQFGLDRRHRQGGRDGRDQLRDKLLDAAAELLQTEPAKISIAGDRAHITETPDVCVSLAEIARYFEQSGQPSLSEAEIKWSGEAPTILYGYNAGLIELDVNTETGQVRLLNHVNVCDPGTRINPLAVDGQIDGAIAFGIGFALSERFHPDNPATLEGYGLPSTHAVPAEVTRLYVEDPLETRSVRGQEHGGASGHFAHSRHRQRNCRCNGRAGARHTGNAGSDKGRLIGARRGVSA